MANLYQEFRSDILKSAKVPLFFLAICWLVFFIENYFQLSFYQWGIKPLDFKGLRGVLFMPFLHASLDHILNNSFGILTLGTMLFFFYKEIASKIFIFIFFISGIWTWSIAGGGYHIGASAIIYGLFGFLTLSGMIRKDKQLLAITFLVVFLYQGIVWGVLPSKPEISWQGHLAGFLSGIVLAIYYKKDGPQKKKIVINDDDSFNEMRFGKYYWDEEKYQEEQEKKRAESAEIKLVYFITPQNQHESDRRANH